MNGPFTNFATDISEISIISSNEGGNKIKIVDFMEYSRYFQVSPSQGTQAMLTQETKKV